MVSELHDRPRSAQHTRAQLLDAAEALFAERGFDATRLEDVARAVGIRRASIVYHFRDKRAVYHAVLERVLEALRQALSQALAGSGSPTQRVEAAVEAWVGFLEVRPAFGPLLLRELANAGSSDGALAERVGGFEALVRDFRAELERRDEHFDDPIDPAHFAAAIAGATVIYSVSLPNVVSNLGEGGDRAHHRSEVLRITRRLLNVNATANTRNEDPK